VEDAKISEQSIDWSTYQQGFFCAPNISSGFWSIELDMLEAYGMGESLILVAEPEAVVPVLKRRFPGKEITTLPYSGIRGEGFEYDLCIPFEYPRKFDSALCQATLEHIPRPATAIENMLRLLNPRGILVLHTVGPGSPYHRFPVDCLRFWPDFYPEVTKYLNPRCKLITLVERDHHQFAVWRRQEENYYPSAHAEDGAGE